MKIRDAVSVVLTCQEDVFAVQRQPFLQAFPGYWAFPGGKVDPLDAHFNFNSHLLKNIDQRLFGAVVREVHEELGIDLLKEINTKNITSIHLLGLATTPDFNPHRFATYFFKIEFVRKPHVVVDENEARIADWMKANELYEMYEKGHLLAVPPVIKLMKELGKNPYLTKIEDLEFEYDANQFVPMIEPLWGIKQLMPRSNTLPPATRTNAFLISDDVLVDPSPMNEDEYEKLKNTLKQFSCHKILLTHHHPDHIERANILARELSLPILLSKKTFEFIKKLKTQYFENVEVIFVKENDIVTSWLSSPVKVMEIPGHDEGQIALYPENLNWFLAGDLFQGIGTVVIGGEEGDMTKYFHTLARIIELSPRVIFPSHGIGLGGTYILEKTLNHRREREKEILHHCLEGRTAEEMLPLIYTDIDPKLMPYALMNIHKHMEKLRNEKMISK